LAAIAADKRSSFAGGTISRIKTVDGARTILLTFASRLRRTRTAGPRRSNGTDRVLSKQGPGGTKDGRQPSAQVRPGHLRTLRESLVAPSYEASKTTVDARGPGQARGSKTAPGLTRQLLDGTGWVVPVDFSHSCAAFRPTAGIPIVGPRSRSCAAGEGDSKVAGSRRITNYNHRLTPPVIASSRARIHGLLGIPGPWS